MSLPISYASGLSALPRALLLTLAVFLPLFARFVEAGGLQPVLPALSPDYPQSDIVRYVALGCAAFLVWFGIFGSRDVWTIDSDGLTLVRSRWWGSKTEHHDLSAIASVTAQESVTEGSAGNWRLRIRLKSGRTLSFRFGDSWDEVYQAKLDIEDAMTSPTM